MQKELAETWKTIDAQADVSVVRTIEEAVELVQRTHPGLILMDLSMPVMDGYEATRRIKALPELGGVPVVAVSAFCDAYSKHKALEAGCVDCVSKPANFVTIDSLVSRLLQGHW